jgi:hypothetical protein
MLQNYLIIGLGLVVLLLTLTVMYLVSALTNIKHILDNITTRLWLVSIRKSTYTQKFLELYTQVQALEKYTSQDLARAESAEQQLHALSANLPLRKLGSLKYLALDPYDGASIGG